MAYAVKILRAAQDALRDLPKKERERIVQKIDASKSGLALTAAPVPERVGDLAAPPCVVAA